jgi:hypothetical protein
MADPYDSDLRQSWLSPKKSNNLHTRNSSLVDSLCKSRGFLNRLMSATDTEFKENNIRDDKLRNTQ